MELFWSKKQRENNREKREQIQSSFCSCFLTPLLSSFFASSLLCLNSVVFPHTKNPERSAENNNTQRERNDRKRFRRARREGAFLVCLLYTSDAADE